MSEPIDFNAPQGSPDWLRARLGRVTASRVADVIAKAKTGWGASRANYAAQLVAERLTGAAGDSYTNSAMQWGIDHEAEARQAYSFYSDCSVVEVGFIPHPAIEMSGASPDGHIGTDGSLELKCPSTATHIETLLGGSVPGKYITQMQWQMACSTRQWCDFASYDPRMPESMRLFVRRVRRDSAMIAELEKQVRTFLKEIDATVVELTARYGTKEAA
jgi:putative phage-type endonuclease